MGIGKQSAFGTTATTLTPVKVTAVDPGFTLNRIENDEIFGGIDQFAPINGTREASLSLSGRAYPDSLGMFLQMLAGNPTTTGAAAPYSHKFTPGDALPPRYTVGLSEPNGISSKVTDFMVSSFTLTQEVGNVLNFDVGGIGSNRTVGSVSITGTPSTASAFRFDDFTATLKGDANVNFKSLSITVSNPISNIFALNGTDRAATQEFTGRRTVEVSGTMRFVDDAKSLRNEFETNASMSLVLTWTVNANTSLEVSIPDFRVSDHNWTRGFSETEVDFSGGGYTDGTGAISFTLENDKATY